MLILSGSEDQYAGPAVPRVEWQPDNSPARASRSGCAGHLQGTIVKMKHLIETTVLSLLVALGVCSGAARAQSEFPAKPVSLIVPFPPGGAVDQAGRSIAQSLSKVWKQPVIIVTRPGAGGGVGMAAAANSPPDGYTLLAIHPAILAVPEADRMFGRTPTSERSDFAPLALLVADPLVLVVKADAPWKTYEEFVADARRHPDTIAYSSCLLYTSPSPRD